ncbi:MAG TPA: EF-hand domain-containing protein [Burkholderiales bacterium]
MRRNTLIAVSIAAAFALPLTVQAGGDKASQGASSSAATGAEKMFQSLDKNKDGSLSRDEVKGSPHDKDFATLDKNKDGKLTRQEHAAAAEHAGDKAAAGGTSSKPKY